MQAILEKLRAKGLLEDQIASEIAALWKYGVEMVSESVLRTALTDFLVNDTPLYFFVGTASLTGRNHPYWQHKIGGILRNTVECCLALDRQLRIFPQFTDEHDRVLPGARDIVLVATILSDTFKFGDGALDANGAFDREHGKTAADVWVRIADKHGVSPRVRDEICDAIYWHLGRWTPGWKTETKLSAYADVTHRVDMFMSDRNLEILYDPKPQLVVSASAKPQSLSQFSPPSASASDESRTMEFERAKICYEQNCESARGLNQIMWQVPVIAMTLTGGLWYGVASLKDIDTPVKYGLLAFVCVADFALIFVIQPVRSVMEAYLGRIRDFHLHSFADTQSGVATKWLPERGVANTFCGLLFVAGLMSLVGLFVIGASATSGDTTSLVGQASSSAQKATSKSLAATPQSTR